MIRIPYILIVSILIVIWTIYRISVIKKSKEKNVMREIFINVFFIYFLILINLTICKGSVLQISFEDKRSINYIPLVETIKMFQNNYMGIGNTLYNVVGNIVLFLPLGFFIPLLFKKKNSVLNIALYGFITSLTIELIQLLTSSNITDVDDIIFNTLGAALGFLIFNVFYRIIKKTKLKYLPRSVTSTFDGNLVTLIIKPVSIMFVIVSLFSIITVYNSTMSSNTSDEEIANSVFQYNSNTEFQAVKEILGYKIFLKEEGDYVELKAVQKVLNNRWLDIRNCTGQYLKVDGDYSIGIIYDDITEQNVTMSVLAFGKNKDASKVEIIFNGKSYSEEIKSNEYFLIAFPSFETLENKGIHNIYNGLESKDLKIEFFDKNGNKYNDMKFATNTFQVRFK
ncbi:VanZ family protein [uncultured Clostridium sp.]|uniref:VanZ family protein n=1 Tax=uncultured Clostridium sp. TaxID=59620 RepID=UPI0028EC1923|nr:VanZ family protein [uncultured Clostridium sp.]